MWIIVERDGGKWILRLELDWDLEDLNWVFQGSDKLIARLLAFEALKVAKRGS